MPLLLDSTMLLKPPAHNQRSFKASQASSHLLVPKVGSFTGRSTVPLLLDSTMLLRPLSTVPTSSAVNSANSWKPVKPRMYLRGKQAVNLGVQKMRPQWLNDLGQASDSA